MISSVIQVSCATCGRKVHGIAPLGWTAEQLVEHVELDEHGWQMHTAASTPEASDLPSSYEHSALCPSHRKAFGQDFPGAKRITMRAPAADGAEMEQESGMTDEELWQNGAAARPDKSLLGCAS